MMDNSNIDLYGLIGFPLGHSFSKNYFNQKFSAESINAKYINFEIPDINFLMEVISENKNLNGLNVTIPYKEQVIPFLDELDDDAAKIGAVNVIKIIKGNKSNKFKLKGYNSDVIGFVNSIEPLIKAHHTHALILGTGGASKAVMYGLEKIGIKGQYVSRNSSSNAILYSDLNEELLSKYTIIINTTPLGMYPNIDSYPDIPYEYITSKHLCYDLLYNPDETAFMRKAKANGAEVKNGLEMLLLQAFAAWNMWQSK